jgi:hypothetical protein
MLCTMGPSTLSTRAPYLGSEIHGPGTQVDFGRTFKPALAAIVPWVFKPTLVAQVDANSRNQAHSGGTS